MGNPFEGNADTAVATDVAVVEPDADLDVDAGSDAVEDTVEDSAPPRTGNVRKTGEAKPKSTRTKPAEGYIAPVEAAKVLSKHLTEKARAAGQIADDEEIHIAPQVVYATLKNNSDKSKHPIPQYTDLAITGGIKAVVKVDEFLKWWDEKDKRVAERKTNVKKAKVETPVAEDAPTAPPVEAE